MFIIEKVQMVFVFAFFPISMIWKNKNKSKKKRLSNMVNKTIPHWCAIPAVDRRYPSSIYAFDFSFTNFFLHHISISNCCIQSESQQIWSSQAMSRILIFHFIREVKQWFTSLPLGVNGMICMCIMLPFPRSQICVLSRGENGTNRK